ncbi:PTS system nitrogen regulatory IIA component [Luteimonas cucumeris]|uniref:PTS system nitrogen regulatory IIA component n=1 Tax=Luteimonas cucumeris TaxID=985012 RepID=A0A562KYA2_9GAMM|nr:PTS sugar transporter subunit IIA [Luteimonas cucumeris]TWI00328.1 PTS system nitrogen regulatory IIA component [Luteimonas cucumeris]
MPLNQLLSAGRILPAVEAGDRAAVIEVAARLLSGDDPAQATAIADGLRQRERLGSTAIGHGIAIPHGRSAVLGEPRGAFLRLVEPIDFGASDGQAVDLVFALIVPEHFTQQHLQLLSELAERFADADFRSALREADDAQALLRLLAGPVETLHADARRA